jgi:hypothetical protein
MASKMAKFLRAPDQPALAPCAFFVGHPVVRREDQSLVLPSRPPCAYCLCCACECLCRRAHSPRGGEWLSRELARPIAHAAIRQVSSGEPHGNELPESQHHVSRPSSSALRRAPPLIECWTSPSVPDDGYWPLRLYWPLLRTEGVPFGSRSESTRRCYQRGVPLNIADSGSAQASVTERLIALPPERKGCAMRSMRSWPGCAQKLKRVGDWPCGSNGRITGNCVPRKSRSIHDRKPPRRVSEPSGRI